VATGADPESAVAVAPDAPLELVAGWPKLPAGWTFTMVSNISADSRGRIYVASRGDQPIAVVVPSGRFVGTLGEDAIQPAMNYDLTVSPPKPISVKRWAHGIHVDGSDNIWVTDLARHIVLKLDPKGKVLMTLGTLGQHGESPAHFNQPSSVAVARSGSIYVADGYGNSRVVQYTPDGKFVRAWGRKGRGRGEFDTPHCIAVDDRGNVYVAERMNNRVQVFDPAGKFLAEWPDIARADAITIRGGVAYVGTGAEKRLYRYDLNGKRLGEVGAPGTVGYTHGIYVSASGELYVADPIAEDAHKAPAKFAPRAR
jgi:DNA-binding beta-propeller fold protein YncE